MPPALPTDAGVTFELVGVRIVLPCAFVLHAGPDVRITRARATAARRGGNPRASVILALP